MSKKYIWKDKTEAELRKALFKRREQRLDFSFVHVSGRPEVVKLWDNINCIRINHKTIP